MGKSYHFIMPKRLPLLEDVKKKKVYKVSLIDGKGEFIDDTEVDEKDDELAWSLFKVRTQKTGWRQA